MYTTYDAYPTMRTVYTELGESLVREIQDEESVEVPTWQGQDVAGSAWGATYELQNVVFETHLPGTAREAEIVTGCNMPWAEEHFRERVSGIPYNPPPSAANWPFAKNAHKEVTSEVGQFSHTYPERFWCKVGPMAPLWAKEEGDDRIVGPMKGLRFEYGDLSDVVKLLAKDPTTRQAYLPVFFPEDTGAHHGERIPCTLGYHFMIRNNRLSITYFIRSCDFLRHFPDDVYMAMRLAQWVREEIQVAKPDEQTPGLGTLTMHICSLHVFEGDRQVMEYRYGHN